MYCTKCGHKNSDDDRFCSLCGHSLGPPDETTMQIALEEAEIEHEGPGLEELGPDQGLLVVKRGPNAGSKFLLDRDVVTIGRQPDSDIFLNDVTVSRRHAEVLRDASRFLVKDAGSLNGTYVNRERVDVAELANGDELQVGKFKLVFFSSGAS
jgi:hypothetical protein